MHGLDEARASVSSVFIRKTIKLRQDPDKTKKNFQNETETLQLLHRIRHPNIVELLCAYTYRSEHSFVFPSHDMDLREFLSRPERYGSFSQDEVYYQALQGLASALHSLHYLKLNSSNHDIDAVRVGYHHDLRPANILVTDKTFKLADFGLSKLKHVELGSQTDFKVGAGDYAAPECMDEDFVGQRVGRPIDIWAFGCMIVEVVTYMVGGASLVSTAREDRCCTASSEWKVKTSYFWLGTDLKPAVALLMDSLQERSLTSQDNVSGLILTARRMLKIGPKLRPDSASVFDALSFLATKKAFEIARSSLQQYVESVRGQGDSGPPILNVLFEMERLKLWGRVLDLDKKDLAFENLAHTLNEDGRSRAQKNLGRIADVAKARQEIPPQDSAIGDSGAGIHLSLYSQMHDELRQIIADLCELLPLSLQKRIDRMWLANMTSTDNMRELNKQARASYELGRSDYEELGAVATIKSLRLALNDLSVSHSDMSQARLDDEQIEEESFYHGHEVGWLQASSSSRQAGRSGRTRVFIERVPYSSTWDKRPPEERARRILSLVKLLRAAPRPQDFCALECLGFTDPSESDEGYKLIFAFPTSQMHEVVHDTLLLQLQAAKTKQGKSNQRPSLTQRVTLAQKLSRSLHVFHLAGWLHKALNSSNIVFFSHPVDAGAPDLAKPYIVNFGFSRPEDPGWFTDGPEEDNSFAIYQHPEYLSGKEAMNIDKSIKVDTQYQKRYDYYSLGVIMLEIGSWEPLESYRKRHGTDDPAAFSQKLISKYAPRLEMYMGRLYTEATISCLKGDFAPLEENGNSGQLSRYWTEVVEPLADIHVG